jgi:hypothetical protein
MTREEEVTLRAQVEANRRVIMVLSSALLMANRTIDGDDAQNFLIASGNDAATAAELEPEVRRAVQPAAHRRTSPAKTSR